MTTQADQPLALKQTSDNLMDLLDPVARRRLQNRLNQRASNRKWVVYVENSDIPKKNALTEEATNHQVAKLPLPAHQTEEQLCYCNPSQRDDLMRNIRAKALHMIENPRLSPNITFCTNQGSILRAMLTNADLMGLTIDLLNEDLASQFNLVGPSTLHLPASLCPSQTQRKIIHHPWIDLIPMVSLREALLIRVDELDEDELCCDLYGACDPSQEVGIRVWGESWDPFAYEASETLIRKWSWLVTDCPDIIISSNFWRRQRGEKPIGFRRIK
ncbi:unnamed protein product [Penicillium glandicola]